MQRISYNNSIKCSLRSIRYWYSLMIMDLKGGLIMPLQGNIRKILMVEATEVSHGTIFSHPQKTTLIPITKLQMETSLP